MKRKSFYIILKLPLRKNALPRTQGSYRQDETKFPDISLTPFQISLTKPQNHSHQRQTFVYGYSEQLCRLFDGGGGGGGGAFSDHNSSLSTKWLHELTRGLMSLNYSP